MDGVLLLLGNPLNPVRAEAEPSGRLLLTPSWNHAKVMISDMRFLHNLREFDKVHPSHCHCLLPSPNQGPSGAGTPAILDAFRIGVNDEDSRNSQYPTALLLFGFFS